MSDAQSTRMLIERVMPELVNAKDLTGRRRSDSGHSPCGHKIMQKTGKMLSGERQIMVFDNKEPPADVTGDFN
jgi:hypothetical protein